MHALKLAEAALLDSTMSMLDSGNTSAAIDSLRAGLRLIRGEKGPQHWKSFVETVCRVHPLAERLRQDPFTKRSVDKPRGYPGDAVLLDFIYTGLSGDHAAGVSNEGIRIFEATRTESESALAVRERRDLLTRHIDEVADAIDAPRILSVACGHLREAFESEAVRRGRVREFLALDQDLEIVTYRFSFRMLFRTLRQCKLYDYRNRCWLDFDGRPTTRSLSDDAATVTPAGTPFKSSTSSPVA